VEEGLPEAYSIFSIRIQFFHSKPIMRQNGGFGKFFGGFGPLMEGGICLDLAGERGGKTS